MAVTGPAERAGCPLGGDLGADQLKQPSHPITSPATPGIPVARAKTGVLDPAVAGGQQDLGKLGVLGEFGPQQPRHDRDPDNRPVRADGGLLGEFLCFVGPVRCADLFGCGRVCGGERPVGVDDGQAVLAGGSAGTPRSPPRRR
jgi:hypothetical protein